MQFLFTLTSFLSAYILFQVQPIVSKYFLPFFGGSSSVWVVTLLTFQTLLVFGYLYGLLIVRLRLRFQILIQILILVLVFLFQNQISGNWTSFILPTINHPNEIVSQFPVSSLVWWILLSVGLIYLLLASTTNIIQTWYFRNFKTKKSPYFLYRASNLGSFLGLLAYPFLFEPFTTVKTQSLFIYLLFGIYTACIFILGIQLFRKNPDYYKETKIKKVSGKRVRIKTYLRWIGLSSLTSTILVSTSQIITTGIAPVPFLWVVPLSLYLLSFVVGFTDFGKKKSLILKLVYGAIVTGLFYRIFENLGYSNFYFQVGIYNIFLFFTCLLIHNKLYEERPEPNLLSNYYLALSIGGALGGVFVGVIAPYLFSDYWEFDISLLASIYVGTGIIQSYYLKGRGTQKEVAFQIKFKRFQFGIALFLIMIAFTLNSKNVIYRSRNFYGTLKVFDFGDYRTLKNGIILHGSQLIDDKLKYTPTSYYTKTSALNQLINKLKSENKKLTIGSVGLGTGTIAAYCDEKTKVTFYEINSQVLTVAREYFSFLDKCDSTEVKLGDGRLLLNSEKTNTYDILVIDAFTDDSIPMHLLTREAFEVYLNDLSDEGVLAVHISNRYLDLAVPIKKIADNLELNIISIIDKNEPRRNSSPSEWILLSKNSSILKFDLVENTEIRNLNELGDGIVWTDDFSSILPIMKI